MGHPSSDHGPDAHGPAPAAPEPPKRPPEHVFALARVTTWLGMGLLLAGLAAFLYYGFTDAWTCAAVAAFCAVYGFCTWLAARETLSLEYRGTAAR